MKHLTDSAAVARASGEALRAARKLESLSVRSRETEEKGETDRSRIQELEAEVATLKLRVAELERVRI